MIQETRYTKIYVHFTNFRTSKTTKFLVITLELLTFLLVDVFKKLCNMIRHV